MKTLKLNVEDTVKTLFYAKGFRTSTTTEQINETIKLLLNMAVSARIKNKIDYSNKLIDFAICVKNCYACCFQGSKKARKTFLIDDFKELKIQN